MTASYELKHEETGAERHWSGSFMPGGNTLNNLGEFRLFGPNFETEVKYLADIDRATERLRFVGLDTKWKFESLTSIVINVQALVIRNHPTLHNRDLLHHARRFHRSHITFPLP